MTPPLPELREIAVSEVIGYEELPRPRIRIDHDIETWRKTRSYQDYTIFLRRLNEAVVGHYLPYESPCPSQVIPVHI
jgi:serine/threonine-protein phosphatase 2A activator